MKRVYDFFKSFYGSDVEFTAKEYTKVFNELCKTENSKSSFSELVMKTDYSEKKVMRVLKHMLEEDVVGVTL